MTDDDLIRCFIEEGCEFTIPILYERYGHLVMGSCLNYLKQFENAEDVTMRIFTELASNLKRYEIQYFKEKMGVSSQAVTGAIRATGSNDRKVLEKYLKDKQK